MPTTFSDQNRFPVLGEDYDPISAITNLSGSASPNFAVPLTGKEAKRAELPGLGQPGLDNRTGLPLGTDVFQKGWLKGVDKGVFLGMLGDALTGLGGGESRGLTRQAIEARAKRMELRARQKQIEEDRAFDEEQRRLDREARMTEVDKGIDQKGKDREHETALATLRINAERSNLERNAALEEESIALRAKYGASADEVVDLFRDTSTFEGLNLPSHINAKAAMDDPTVLAEARLLIAPFKERRIQAQLERSSPQAAKRNAEALSEMAHSEVLWRAGKRMPTKIELESGMPPDPIPIGVPLGERVRLTVAALQPNEVMNPDINMDNRLQVARDLFEEFQLLGGGAFFSLDQQHQQNKRAQLMDNIRVLWDNAIARRRAEIRAQNAEGRLQAPPLDRRPIDPQTRRQREAEAGMSPRGGSRR